MTFSSMSPPATGTGTRALKRPPVPLPRFARYGGHPGFASPCRGLAFARRTDCPSPASLRSLVPRSRGGAKGIQPSFQAFLGHSYADRAREVQRRVRFRLARDLVAARAQRVEDLLADAVVDLEAVALVVHPRRVDRRLQRAL